MKVALGVERWGKVDRKMCVPLCLITQSCLTLLPHGL